MLIMSFSAEPFAEASTTFERQLAAIADRLPERRASHTATPTMMTAPSKTHSHRSEEADSPLAAGDDESAVGAAEGGSADGEGATADAVTVGWTAEGLGDLVPGENVGGETLMLLLAAALDIPGGVLETLRQQGADGTVTNEDRVDITALHSISPPRYARPAPNPSGSAG